MTQIAHGDATLIDRVHAQYTTCVRDTRSKATGNSETTSAQDVNCL